MAASIIGALFAAGLGGATAIKSAEDKKKADQQAKRAMAARVSQQTPDSLTEQAALARGQLNAINPAVVAGYQQAQQLQANAQGFAQRNAASGAQALQAAATAQAQSQAVLPQLAQVQSQYQQQNLQNYNQALGGLTDDARLKVQDQQAANADRVNFYLGKVGAGSQGIASGLNLAAGGVASALGNMKKPTPTTQPTTLSPMGVVNPTMGLYGNYNPPISMTAPAGIANPNLGLYGNYRNGYNRYGLY